MADKSYVKIIVDGVNYFLKNTKKVVEVYKVGEADDLGEVVVLTTPWEMKNITQERWETYSNFMDRLDEAVGSNIHGKNGDPICSHKGFLDGQVIRLELEALIRSKVS